MITRPNAKINLGLNVLRKREDGYHDLETLFLPCDEVSDTLEIIRGDDYSHTVASIQERYDPSQTAQAISPDGSVMITIARREGVDWDPLRDLTVKAIMIMAEGRKLPPLKVFLEKGIPVGAGLGGGSADAAFALRMVSTMLGFNLSEEALCEMASRIGSDCPFFIRNIPQFGEGRGEILSPMDIPALKDYRMELCLPEGISVSTAEAYRGIVPAVPDLSLKDVLSRPVHQWRDLLTNDFEKTVFAVHPELAALKQSLYDRGAVYASMSGSGSALFALFQK